MAMTAEINTNIKYHFARAILRQLWAAGWITEEEMKRIDARNAQTFK